MKTWLKKNPISDSTYIPKGKFDPKTLKLDYNEFFEDFDEEIEVFPTNYAEIDVQMVPSQYYNFSNHYVKNRKKNRRKLKITNVN